MGTHRILVVRWKCIGDVVFTLPAVNRLRDVHPSAEITFLVSRENAFILEGFRSVDRVWVMDRQSLRTRRFAHAALALADLILQVRQHRFSLVVDLQAYGESAALARWSGAPTRLGYDKGRLRRLAYTRFRTLERQPHPAGQHLALLDDGGIPAAPLRNELVLPEAHRAAARDFLASRAIAPSRPLVYLQPFTSAAHKNWPLANHLALADALTASGIQVLLGGGPDDRRRLREAGVSANRIIDAPRMTDMALVQASDVVVGGDTGFIHIANALGRPVILLGRPGAVLPFGRPGSALLSPDNSMASIPVESVLEKVRSILAGGRGNPVG